METLDVLAFAAHPDDTELCCGGTLARLVHQGKKVGVVDLTRGEMGTRGTPEQRMEEAETAADIIGLSLRKNLGLPDTRIENSRKNQKKDYTNSAAISPIRLFCGSSFRPASRPRLCNPAGIGCLVLQRPD